MRLIRTEALARTLASALVLASVLAVVPARAEDAPTPADPSASAAQDPDEGDVESLVPKRTHFAFGAGAGATAIDFHSDAIFLGGAFLSFGADTRVGMFDGVVKYERGSTEHGLGAQSFAAGGGFSWALDRLRLGVGVHTGWFSVDRITSDSSFDFVTLGLDGLLGVELVRTGGFSLALALRPRVAAALQFAILEASDDTAIGGATLGLEIRVRAPRAAKRTATAAR